MPDVPAPDPLADLPTYLLSRVGRHARAIAATHLAAVDLRLDEFAALTTLETATEPPSQRAFAEALRRDPSDIVRLLDGLESRGLTSRTRDPTDRRRQIAALTPAGRKALARGRAACDEAATDLLGPLAAKEQTQLIKLLQRLTPAAS